MGTGDVQLSDLTWHLFGLRCHPPTVPWLWVHGLAEPGYGFHFTCKYPEECATYQKIVLGHPFVTLKALWTHDILLSILF